MTIKDDIKAIVAEHPGLSAPEIANCLARDPRNTRRDIAELKVRGELVTRKDERGVDRYCVTGSTLLRDTAGRGGSLRPASAWQPEFPKSPESSSQVIDAEYTDVTDSRLSALPASYGGVVVHQAAGLPATTRGRSLVPYYGDAAPYMAGVLARMFDIDPDGSLLEAAQIRQATASVLGENERLRAALDRERRKAITVQAEVQKKAEADEIHDAIQWALRRTEDTEEKPLSLAEQERRARTQRRMEGDEENARLYQEGLRKQEQGTAAAARHIDSVRRSMFTRSFKSRGEVCLDDGNHDVCWRSARRRLASTPSKSRNGAPRLPRTPWSGQIMGWRRRVSGEMPVKTIS